MRTVLKFAVDARHPVLDMPPGAKVLLVCHEPKTPRWVVTVWAECEVKTTEGLPTLDGTPLVAREVAIFGTGQVIPDDKLLVHLGSVLIYDELGGQIVWHLYERVKL